MIERFTRGKSYTFQFDCGHAVRRLPGFLLTQFEIVVGQRIEGRIDDLLRAMSDVRALVEAADAEARNRLPMVDFVGMTNFEFKAIGECISMFGVMPIDRWFVLHVLLPQVEYVLEYARSQYGAELVTSIVR